LEGGSSGNLSSYWLAVEKIRQNAAQAVLKTLFGDPNLSLKQKMDSSRIFWRPIVGKENGGLGTCKPSFQKLGD
jgi:hypothetical protein